MLRRSGRLLTVGRSGGVGAGRVGGRPGGGPQRHDVVGEHAPQLLVVQPVEPNAVVVHRGRLLHEGDRVADGAAVGVPAGGGEVEELVHPRARMGGRGRGRRHHLEWEGRPVVGHGDWGLGR